MFLGEALLSSFLSVVLGKLISPELINYARRQKVDIATLKEWKRTLMNIEKLLNDAEEKQIEDTAVKAWLDDLKALAYDVEDVLDEFDTEAKRQSLVQGSQTSTSKVRKLIPTCCTSFDRSDVMFNAEIGKKIKKITEELDAIAKQVTDLGLREGVGGVSFGTQKRPKTTSSVDESGVYGRDHNKNEIIKLLLSDEGTSSNKVSVIPIVGMGGVGKTTLAQIIYNDHRMENHFDKRIWVCVSDQFDVMGITEAILEKITGSPCNMKNLEPLQDKLKHELKGKKFFLVLDDVWNKDYVSWDNLRVPLEVGAQGSKIIVTTREESVASIMRTVPCSHTLRELSFDDCWLLFARVAFENVNSEARQNLEPIGVEIVKRCQGLPLAAKTLAGLLRSAQSEDAWNHILKSGIWKLPNVGSGILPALRLSYYYLPANLKRCFAYCSVFPKDYEFEKKNLVLLWMAEGLVDDLKTGETMEEVGDVYFHDLLSRSFFQQSSDNESLFVMHDLINDLAKFVSGKFCFRLEANNQDEISEKVRHSSYDRKEFDDFAKFNPFYVVKNLRTFLPLNLPYEGFRFRLFCNLSNKVPHHLFLTLKCLRVLSLSHYGIIELSDSIGNLKHLRYLDLSRTKIERLPESTSTLYNLQTLMLSGCVSLIELPDSIRNMKHIRYLDLSGTSIKKLPESTSTLYNLHTLLLSNSRSQTKLPVDMEKLINLRHLGIDGTSLEEMPIQMSRLKGLQTLTAFMVGKDSGSTIRELGELQHLRGTLSIQNLQNVVYAADALGADLKNKKYIDKLVLNWGLASELWSRLLHREIDDSEKEKDVLDKLQPHTNLKKLTVEDYGGTTFPNWLGNRSFYNNMVFLRLSNCKHCSLLPPLGQLPSLKDLTIASMNGVGEVGPEFYGDGPSSIKPFQSLETLMFEGMVEWQEWLPFGDEGGEFPCLRKLFIKRCPKLIGNLPNHLPSLMRLEISGCRQLVSPLPRTSCIHELELDGCDEVVLRSVVGLTSLSSLRIAGISNSTREPDGQITQLEELPLELQSLTSLKQLYIKDCPRFLSFPETGLPRTLEALHMSFPTLKSLTIETLEIHNCDSLRSFPLGFFTKLSYLKIFNCKNLESLCIPDRPHDGGLSSLLHLYISCCPNLVSFPKGGLPTPNLESFHCSNLKSLPERMHNLTSLRTLSISDCPELVSIAERGLPSNLEDLWIENCDKLTPRVEWGLQRLSSLKSFSIEGGCKDVESFREEWLLPSSLTTLSIDSLPNLKTLEKNGFQHLTSLSHLQIYNCPNLQSLPKEGLPASLFLLYIKNCPLLKQWCQNEKGEVRRKIAQCIMIDELLADFH